MEDTLVKGKKATRERERREREREEREREKKETQYLTEPTHYYLTGPSTPY